MDDRDRHRLLIRHILPRPHRSHQKLNGLFRRRRTIDRQHDLPEWSWSLFDDQNGAGQMMKGMGGDAAQHEAIQRVQPAGTDGDELHPPPGMLDERGGHRSALRHDPPAQVQAFQQIHRLPFGFLGMRFHPGDLGFDIPLGAHHDRLHDKRGAQRGNVHDVQHLDGRRLRQRQPRHPLHRPLSVLRSIGCDQDIHAFILSFRWLPGPSDGPKPLSEALG